MASQSYSVAFSYHVFLSFRGSDTRLGFTGNLYKALTDKGIHTFIDDEDLQRGQEITPTLVKSIQESRIAIVVLSKDYASSSFCLDELATISDCKSKGLLVIPVFYKVDPSDVRHHRGSYGDALAKHERRLKHNMDKLQKWKEALRQLADLSGYHFKEGDEYEYKFIESIVASVSKKVNHPARLRDGDYLVGLKSRVAEVMKLLDVGCDDVVMIGIHGMGGVGKSTLARAVYNYLIPGMFDGWCYLENVREESNKNGLKHLQNVLLHEILKDKNINVASWRQGTSIIEDRLQRKKVVLVVDDVDKDEQLQAFVGSPYWYGPGSRIIITTRDKQLLESHQVKVRYEVHELNKDDALQLLTWNAFRKEKADPIYAGVLNSVLKYASGLPLALEVIGSNLFGKSIESWESAMNQYKRIPHNRIQDILKVSFDALQDEEKSVFLDIVCCRLKVYELKEVEVILNALYGDNVEYHIGVLVDKSLVKVDWDGTVKMHDLIQDMGRKIDLKESPKNPEKRRRLWLPNDIIKVLQSNTGTRGIEIMYLEVPTSTKEQTIKWDGNGFKEMKNLKILIIKNAEFSEGPKCLPNNLMVLEWWGYPSNRLPSDFQPENLIICKLPSGCFTSFELGRPSKMFQNLTVLEFDLCISLTHLPDVSDLSNLERLSFKHCDNLFTVHESIGHLAKIKEISAYGCRNLVSFPPIHLTSLEKLELSNCERLESFPEILGKMENISGLYLSGTAIKELPISFVNLVRLQSLNIYDCRSSIQLPSSIFMMPELTSFICYNEKGMKWVKQEEDEETMGSILSSKVSGLTFQDSNLDDDFFLIGFTRFAHVQDLNLSGNNFTFIPEFFKDFQSLTNLDVSDCEHLREIRGVPPNLNRFNARNCKSLTSLSISMFINQELHEAGMSECHLPGAWIPEWLEHQSRGHSTSFWFRNELPHNILWFLIAPLYFDLIYVVPIPMVFINGKAQESHFHSPMGALQRIEMDHTYLFDLHWYYDLYEVPLENGWKHVEITYEGVIEASDIKAMGMHVFKGEGGMKDIRYSEPSRKRKKGGDINSTESDKGELVKRSRLMEMEQQILCQLESLCIV